jgi:ABC-type branched-subunit amino acid transport system substrate-binding protein/esterase/lipase
VATLRGVKRLLLVAAALVLWAAPAQAFTKQTGTRTMADGTSIAYDLYEPDGTAPGGGWPGVVVLHGLGGTKDSVASVAQVFASQGYAALAYSARGHGTSTGNIELAGPNEVSDERALESFFAGLPEVSDTQIGAWGISYGGGQTWNGLAAGIPYKAAEVVETWTDLYSALWPQNVARKGVVAGFASAVIQRSPLIAQYQNDALNSTNMGAIKTLVDVRSALGSLSSVRTPVYMFQGRVDYAFDVTQAVNAFARLAGPKHLYVGQFGHPPSTFPGPDIDYVTSQGVAWFDHFLKGAPNGIEKTPQVTIAAATGAKRASYTGLPKTKTIPVGFRGTTATRTGARLGQALETFGVSLLKVNVAKVSRYPHLVAVVLAGKRVITHGAVVPKKGLNTIRLANYVQFLPKGTRLTLQLGPDGGTTDFAYGASPGGTIKLGAAELQLQVLTRPVGASAAFARSAPGVSASTITLGSTVPITGPAALFGSVGRGADAYFKYVNAHGGVNGRKIKFVYLDDAYDPAKTVQLTRQLVEQTHVFAIFSPIGTDNTLATTDYLNAAKVPQLFAGTGTAKVGDNHKSHPWTMGYLPSFRAEGVIYGKAIAKAAGAKVAVLYEDSDFGKDLTNGLKAGLGAKQSAIVSSQAYEPTDTSIESQMSTLHASGANTLVLNVTPQYAILAYLAAHKFGWHPKIYVSSVCISPNVMDIIRANAPELATGSSSIAFVKDPTDSVWAKDKAVALYRSILKRYAPNAKFEDVYNFYGMAVAFTMVDALKKAGKSPTRASLLAAATHLNEVNPFMRPGIKIATSPTDYYPITKAQLVRYDKVHWVAVGPLLSAR